MKQNKIAVIAGTTEGRRFAEYLEEYDRESHILVATEYGDKVLPGFCRCKVHIGRFDAMQLKDFFNEAQITHVYDATHPYAKEITHNCKSACRYLHIPYRRILREELDPADYLPASMWQWFEQLDQTIPYLEETKGNILVTTGSKETDIFTKLSDFEKRIYLRILPDEWQKEQLMQKGFDEAHILMAQGPFSVEHNIEVMEQYHIRHLITKESGVSGGFAEKMKAARQEKVNVLILKRPMDSGISLKEAMKEAESIYGDGQE